MLIEAIKEAGIIAIGGHMRPDGDCVGSCMGLYQYVRENFPEKEVHVYLEEIPHVFDFLTGTSEIRHEVPEGKQVDLFIALDCADALRLGFSAPLYENAKETLCVDHHISNQSFARRNYIRPQASSTSELIFELIDFEKISQKTAECLYTGIVHDTGVFRYSSTSPETMRVAAKLMEKDIPITKIIADTFDEKTYAQQQVLGYSLLESFLFMEGHCIVSSITKKQMEFYQVLPKHLEGIVSQMLLTKDVDVAIFLYELETGIFKVSLRSSERVNVSEVAQYFGGGGHVRAAGVTMNGRANDVISNLARRIELQLKGQENESL